MSAVVRERARVAAAHFVLRANLELRMESAGAQPRLREILAQALLSPWLPPPAETGSGILVDVANVGFDARDDVLVYDRSAMPAALLPDGVADGLFPIDAVLARIAVVRRLDGDSLRTTLRLADRVNALESGIRAGRGSLLPAQVVLAYDSDLSAPADYELTRLRDVTRELGMEFGGSAPELACPVSALCIVGRGCWIVGRHGETTTARWVRATLTDAGHDELLAMLGVLANSCVEIHARRHGRMPDTSLQGAIGTYLLAPGALEELPEPPRIEAVRKARAPR